MLKSLKEEKIMDDKHIPHIFFEAIQARNERTIKRLIVTLIIVIVLFFLSNIAWLYVWQLYDYSGDETVVTVDSKNGPANYIGNDGEIINGEDNGN